MTKTDVKALFGQRVRQLRRMRGYSQEAFAHAIGLDRSYIGQVERGEKNISLENIWIIAHGLEVSLDEIMRFDLLRKDED